MNKKTEAIIDIALMAGYLISKKRLHVNDSRVLVDIIETLADEFEKQYNPNDDYISSVDDFAVSKLDGEMIE